MSAEQRLGKRSTGPRSSGADFFFFVELLFFAGGTRGAIAFPTGAQPPPCRSAGGRCPLLGHKPPREIGERSATPFFLVPKSPCAREQRTPIVI